jgi:hypothetical protein
MASDLTKSFSKVADGDFAQNVLVAFAAFMAPVVMKNTVERFVNLPDEVYGLVVAVGAYNFLSGDMAKYGAAGGGLYTADQLAERAGIKSTVEGLGGGN